MAATKTEKGSGGKRGQSGKDNRMTHQEEKAHGRVQRRLQQKAEERDAVKWRDEAKTGRADGEG